MFVVQFADWLKLEIPALPHVVYFDLIPVLDYKRQ
jgi:hypothetical protein